MASEEKSIIKLSDIARKVSNVNLDEEIVVFDTSFTAESADRVPTYIDALLLILVTEGSGKLGIDLRQYTVKKNSLIVLQPRNYIYLAVNSQQSSAHVIACTRRVAESILPKLTDFMPLLLHHRTEPVTQLTEEEAASLEAYYHFIHRVLNERPGIYTHRKVQCLLQSALYELMDIHTRNAEITDHKRTRKDEIMARFIIEVGKNFRDERHVGYYADKLCISPKHLSAVVKSVSGLTAGEWIDNYVIMEAKVMLKTTDFTIQQISDDLNFKNQSFFGKYFKHLTGQTPTAYRHLTESDKL